MVWCLLPTQDGMMDSNIESLYNLKRTLDHGINMDDFPVVLQYNKETFPVCCR